MPVCLRNHPLYYVLRRFFIRQDASQVAQDPKNAIRAHNSSSCLGGSTLSSNVRTDVSAQARAGKHPAISDTVPTLFHFVHVSLEPYALSLFNGHTPHGHEKMPASLESNFSRTPHAGRTHKSEPPSIYPGTFGSPPCCDPIFPYTNGIPSYSP